MVRVTVFGGTGNVSKEIVAILGSSGKHEITVFTRSDPSKHITPGVKYIQVNYDDAEDLTTKLQGAHTVLCFISNPSVQMRLIDICINAGVKRFAPNEWAARSRAGIFQYHEKDEVHDYLRKINQDKKVIEYCLFQSGLFMNYLSSPIPSTTFHPIYTNQWDIKNRRAIVPAGHDYEITLTTIQDVAKVLIEALAYEGPWPEIGGITGSLTSSSEIIRIAESIRGPFHIETVSTENLKMGKLGTSWVPRLPDFPDIDVGMDWGLFSEYVIAEIMRGGLKGSWKVSDEWNRLLPDMRLTTVKDFLEHYWKDEP